jgi:putative transposase
MREGLLAASTAVGLEVMAELMAAETDALAGAKGRHQPDRLAYRHGSEAGTVTLDGRRLLRPPTGRPIGRSADQLAAGVVARMLAGLSTRRYRAGLEPVGTAIEAQARGTSRSAVSRRSLAVFRDGFRMGQHLLAGALGVRADGVKVPLGLVEGTTENKVVVTDLVTDLRDRGLDAPEGLLFVIDGGTALGAAVHSIFGGGALVQR